MKKTTKLRIILLSLLLIITIPEFFIASSLNFYIFEVLSSYVYLAVTLFVLVSLGKKSLTFFHFVFLGIDGILVSSLNIINEYLHESSEWMRVYNVIDIAETVVGIVVIILLLVRLAEIIYNAEKKRRSMP